MEEKRRRVEHIADVDLRRAASFALFGMPELDTVRADGMNRNAALLFLPGKRIVMADDDTVFTYYRFGRPEKISRLRDDGRRDEPAFFCAAGKSEKRLRDLLVRYDGSPFADFDAALGGDVVAAMSGVAGGRWYSSPLAALDTEAPLRRLMWKNAADYEDAKTAADAFSLLLPPASSVSPSAFFVACHFACDNTASPDGALPPFLPHIRNDDGIWAMTLRAMYPASRTAYMPFAIEHLPVNTMPLSSPDLFRGTVSSITANGFIRSLLINIFGGIHAAPDTILRSAGDKLCALKTMPRTVWRDFCVDIRLSLAAMEITRFEKVMAAGCAPKFWAKDAAAHYEHLKNSPLSGEPWIPAEFAPLGGERLFREYLDRSGELFAAWAELREAL